VALQEQARHRSQSEAGSQAQTGVHESAGPESGAQELWRRPFLSVSIDAVADAALSPWRSGDVPAGELQCDACDEPIEGEPAGHGLYVWTRGDEVRFEEPALCARCATAIGVTALAAWSVEEEEG
jgi:hypothetical protein